MTLLGRAAGDRLDYRGFQAIIVLPAAEPVHPCQCDSVSASHAT